MVAGLMLGLRLRQMPVDRLAMVLFERLVREHEMAAAEKAPMR